MKKIRIQSLLELQPLHVKQSLAAWLTTGGAHGHGITYKEAKVKLLAEYGVRSCETAICRFFRRTFRAATQTVEAVLTPENQNFILTINVRINPKT